ncbi:MAG: histidinol-phosphate transaminase [Prevotella sp.]|nr:histidinol-phosphate transaminase [Prevotella sp.]
MRPLSELVRPNIWSLQPYSSARNEYNGKAASVFLDANENPYNHPYNRYPDPLQAELKAVLSQKKGVPAENIFLGNGSDEAIDLVYRCFTRPGVDNVVAIEPTYGMYKVCADVNDVAYRPVMLDDCYQLSAERLLSACDGNTKVIWLCSPNNPTGNHLLGEEIVKTLEAFDGIVVVDEAYADFSKRPSFRLVLGHFPNLIVLNTFSKAWGCAGIRLGMAYASKEIIEVFNKVKYPYNVNVLTQRHAIEALNNMEDIDRWVNLLLLERGVVMRAVQQLPCCRQVYPTDSNFFLARFDDAQGLYDYLVGQGIIVRNRSRVALCDNCLRITIGTKEENTALISALRTYCP